MKRIFSLALALSMFFTLLSVSPTANAESGGPTGAVRTAMLDLVTIGDDNLQGSVKTGSVYLNDAEGWSWDSATLTLALSGVNIQVADNAGANRFTSESLYIVTAGIRLPAGAKMTLTSGTVNAVHSADANVDPIILGYGVYAHGGLTVDGAGALLAESGVSVSGACYGIYSYGALAVSGGSVSAAGGTATDGFSYGIYTETGIAVSDAANLYAAGGTIVANAWTSSSLGIYVQSGGMAVSGSAVVSGTGGDTGGTRGGSSYGIIAQGGMTVSGTASVTGTGGGASGKNEQSIGIQGALTMSGAASVTATGGEVAATGYSASYGLYVGDLTIPGGSLIATGGTTASGYSRGITGSGTATIGSASTQPVVIATGGAAPADSTGMYSSRITVISGTVSATGGAAGENSYGINGLYLTFGSASANSAVTAAGGSAGEGYVSGGIYGTDFVTFLGGVTTAKGNTLAVLGRSSITATDMNMKYKVGDAYTGDTTVSGNTTDGFKIYEGSTSTVATDVKVYAQSTAAVPTVITDAATNPTSSGAMLNGSVISDGGAAVSARGFVYGLAADPIIGGAGVTQAGAGTGTGDFSANVSGLASGTTYHFRAYATNSADTAYGEDKTFETLSAVELTITTTALPVAVQNWPYHCTLGASGGTAPYTWSVTSAKPAWLSLNASTGELSGTPTAPATVSLDILVGDSAAPSGSAIKTLTLTVNSPLSVSTAALPDGAIGIPYSATVSAAGGAPPYRWSAVSALPDGLSIDPDTGAISGTPTGYFLSMVAVRVTDSNFHSYLDGYYVDKWLNLNIYDDSIKAVPAAGVLKSGALDGSLVNLTLIGTTFSKTALTPADFTLTGAPAGLTLAEATYTDPSHCTVRLAYSGAPIAANVTSLRIGVKAEAAACGLDLRSNIAVIAAPMPATRQSVAAGNTPTRVEVNPATGKAYVTNQMSRNITVIGSDDAVSSTLFTDQRRPLVVAVNSVTNRIYVANKVENTVSVIDGSTDTLIQNIVLGTGDASNDIREIKVNPDTNKIYVTHYTSKKLMVINGADNTFTTVSLPGAPSALAVNRTTGRVYVCMPDVTCHMLAVIDGADNSLITSFDVGYSPSALAINEVTNRVYVVNSSEYKVTVVNGETNEVAGAIPVEHYPIDIAVNPVTNRVYVANSQSNTVSVINGADNTVFSIPVPGAPQKLAVNTATNRVYVTGADTAMVTELSGLDFSSTSIAVGAGPGGMAVNPANGKVYVTDGDGCSILTPWVCEIVQTSAYYAALDGALDAVTDGQTIRLLQDIGYSGGITVDGKHITFDLNGYNLNVVNPLAGQDGLSVINGGVALTGTGEFNVTGSRCGVYASGEGSAAVVTNAAGTADNSGPGGGACAVNGAAITVKGSAWGKHYGASADGEDSSVTVLGDAASDCYAGSAASAENGGSIRIEGSAGAAYDTVRACGAGSSVTVLGNVTQTGQYGSGAYALEGGEITIDGVITSASYYITVGDTHKGIGDYAEQTTRIGYHTYTDDLSTVWVKEITLPTVYTGAVDAAGVTQTSAAVSGGVTSDGGAAVTERGFVYGLAADPVIGGAGVTQVTAAGAGTGSFTANISGLKAGATYHVRAYATNSAGTAYGEDRAFTTKSDAGGTTAPAYTADVKEGGVKTDTLPVTVDSSKTGTAGLTAAKASGLFGAADASVVMPSIPGVNAYKLKLPASALTADQKGGTLTLTTAFGSVTFPDNMLSSMTGASGKTAGITVGQGDTSGLSDAEKSAIGARPVIRLTLTLNGKQTDWNNPTTPVTVAIPYKPTAAELQNPESIVIWYLDGGGKPVCVPNGHYDAATGTVTFQTTHFSRYAVGYNPVRFNDVASGAWYRGAVSFIAARGITTGIGNGNFGPDAALTRGQFIVMLLRTYGVAADANPYDNFSDAGNTWYTGYLAAAKRLGIAEGVGGNRFAPEQAITRQEMFTLLYRALKVLGQLPQGASGRTLADYSDADQIAFWAKDAMKLLVETGTASGSSGKLNPTGTATRAEMAQVLYNLFMR